jgi:hypothetical protein
MKPTLTPADFQRAASIIGCDVPAIKAVAKIEAPRGAFLPSGKPTLLYERHKFSEFTNGAYDASHPDISNPVAGGYGPAGEHQYDRLDIAAALDSPAALMAASWGMFQIMGFNHKLVGFPVLQDFVNAMYAGEGPQLDAFVGYVVNTNLDGALRTHRWADFARGYNGKNYAINKYDVRIAAAYQEAVWASR